MAVGVWRKHYRTGLGRFKVWAPFVKRMAVELTERDGSAIPMHPSEGGHFDIIPDGVPPGTRYRYLLDAKTGRPDAGGSFRTGGV